MAFAALAGALTGLGQAPFSIWPAAIIGLGLGLTIHLTSRTATRAFALGWAFGGGYFAATLFWIVEPFLVDLARHGWMAPFALVFMAGGMALFWGAAFGAARWLSRSAAAWVVALTAVEMIRGVILTGFPWVSIGHVWIGTPAMQLAAFVGPHGLTILTLAFVAVARAAVVGRSWPAAATAIGLSGGALGLGVAMLAAPMPEATGKTVRLIQPNAAQHLKWDPDHASTFYQRQIELTAAPASPTPDLVVWPESAIPYLLENADPLLREIAAVSGSAPVVIGVQRREGDDFHNSLAVIGSDGAVSQIYDKHHLVPFGEYIPAGDVVGQLGISALAARVAYGYVAGPGPAIVDLGDLGRALPLICYEGIFPRHIHNAPARPDWLLLITNDAWFGQISGPYQHLAQARLRAVEQGLPMVRVANTGVSAVIDARGRVVDALPLGVAGRLDVGLPAALPPTLYARLQDWPVLFVLGLGGAILGWRRHRNIV